MKCEFCGSTQGVREIEMVMYSSDVWDGKAWRRGVAKKVTVKACAGCASKGKG